MRCHIKDFTHYGLFCIHSRHDVQDLLNCLAHAIDTDSRYIPNAILGRFGADSIACAQRCTMDSSHRTHNGRDRTGGGGRNDNNKSYTAC